MAKAKAGKKSPRNLKVSVSAAKKVKGGKIRIK